MHLASHEQSRLLVAVAADLARRRLSRGARLGATEATALLVDEIYEMAWDGFDLDDVIDRTRNILSPEQVLPGVPAMVRQVQVDALFPAGTFLVSVTDPIPAGSDVALAAETSTGSGVHELNAGKPRKQVTVCNTASWPVRVTSHADFAAVNSSLKHDREQTRGWRLDIPAGSSLDWQPGETKTVTLVPVRTTIHKDIDGND